jgi:hypothetical protein
MGRSRLLLKQAFPDARYGGFVSSVVNAHQYIGSGIEREFPEAGEFARSLSG